MVKIDLTEIKTEKNKEVDSLILELEKELKQNNTGKTRNITTLLKVKYKLSLLEIIKRQNELKNECN